MLRALYSALWYFATPLIKRYLRRRAAAAPAYLQHWDERFGAPSAAPVRNAIWLHAVSVGETHAAAPLIDALRRRFPDAPLLITQMTPTGRATAQTLYPDAQCRYLPYDRPDWVRRFLHDHRPRLGILMETEIWPNLMHACRAEQIPLFLANARLSEKSAHGYRKARRLIAPALATLSGCYAQTAEDAERLSQIGATDVRITGNTKYDIPPPPESTGLAQTFRQRIGTRGVWVAASTRVYQGTDEAELILRAWQPYADQGALLIIVPRHPERFQAAFDAAAALRLRVQKRSDNAPVAADTQVWIGDSMGEMAAYYRCADFAFVGGSLVDTGCQNIIEPISCGKAVLFGPSVFNFQAACTDALAAGAAQQIADARQLAATAHQWLQSPEKAQQTAANGAAFIRERQGASETVAALIAAQTGGTKAA